MTASDIVRAYEDGLITEIEAIEQGLVDRLPDLYERSASDQSQRRARASHKTAQHRLH